MKYIGEYTFQSCTALSSVTIPNSVTSIGKSAFSGCTGLTSVTIPNSVTDIGYNAFSDCTGLISLVIGNGVNTIGNWAFSGCNKIKDIVSKRNNPNYIQSQTFSNSTFINSTLFVPLGNLAKYKATLGWKEFKNIIEGEPVVSGDANQDGSVNVTDIVATVNYIMENPTGTFDTKAADVNGDGFINVTDIVGMVNIIMSSGSRMD